VGPNEFPWIQLIFEALDGLPRYVRSHRGVNDNILVGRFNPDDFVDGYEQDTFVILNRETGQPLTPAGA
jgi:hypothetical protein